MFRSLDLFSLFSPIFFPSVYKPPEPSIFVWIVPVVCSWVLALVILFAAAVFFKRRLATQSSPTDTEETIPINRGSINNGELLPRQVF